MVQKNNFGFMSGKKTVKIAPSILSADFSRLKEEVSAVLEAGASMIHVDVMDGHFVPNITIGVPVVESLARAVPAPLDVHLMIENPGKFIDAFVNALGFGGRDFSSDYIVVHAEACEGNLKEVLSAIKACGVKTGFSVKPGTAIERYSDVLGLCDMVLIMTVEPGFGGQKFMADMMGKVEWLVERFSGEIEVDGGVNAETAKVCREAGATVLVAGSHIFKSKDYVEAVRSLR